MTEPRYAEAAGIISAKMQLYYSFRTPVQRAADEAEVLLATPVQHKAHPAAADTDAADSAAGGGDSGGVAAAGAQSVGESGSSSFHSEL